MFLAYLFTILKNVIYGASVFFTASLSNSTDVLDLLSLRFLMSFTALFLLKTTGILKIKVGLRDVFKPTERHAFVKPLLLSALFEPLLYMMLETLGITMTTTTAFGGISTFVTIAIGCLVGKERLYGFHIIGLILIVARMVGVSWITIRDAKRKAAK